MYCSSRTKTPTCLKALRKVSAAELFERSSFRPLILELRSTPRLALCSRRKKTHTALSRSARRRRTPYQASLSPILLIS